MALTNSQYDKIMRIYERKRQNHRAMLTRRREEIAAKLPAYNILEEEIISISMDKVREKLLSNNLDKSNLSGSEQADLKSSLNELIWERKELLLANNYPEDYLELTYDCPLCKDTGYVEDKKCKCFQQEEIRVLYEYSNLLHMPKEENFDTFNLDYYSPQIKDSKGRDAFSLAMKAYDTCENFTRNFGQSFENILIYGDVGTGKTFLTHCIANVLLPQGYSVIYFTSQDLFDALAKQRFQNNSAEQTMDVNNHIWNCDLLIIDDLGTELTNNFSCSALFTCINERYLRKKSTIISTNLSPGKISEIYTERTTSRLSANYIKLKLIGDDIRRKKKN